MLSLQFCCPKCPYERFSAKIPNMEYTVFMRMPSPSMEVVTHEPGHPLAVILKQRLQMSWVRNSKFSLMDWWIVTDYLGSMGRVPWSISKVCPGPGEWGGQRHIYHVFVISRERIGWEASNTHWALRVPRWMAPLFLAEECMLTLEQHQPGQCSRKDLGISKWTILEVIGL